MKTKRATILVVALATLCIASAIGLVSAYYGTSATFYAFGSGSCINISGITGSAPDSSYATISGSGSGTGGQIQVPISGTVAAGNKAKVYCYGSGVNEFYIYVRQAGTSNWNNQIHASTVFPSTAQWITSNVASTVNFNGVLVAVRHTTTGSISANFDCINAPP